MNRKLNPAVEASEAPRRARVRVQEPELLRKHSLTLIGKVTNRSVQKVPSLIPFFTEYWKKQEIRTVGSDLGQGLFQFQFDSESDLLAVLENRPFHFAKWMVILQRWEPTVSQSFPSLIPFWIKIEGIPAHLCTEETIRSIGEDIGHFESSDIISTVRMRVHVNGRLPLIKSSVIEYPNGDEVTASLVYEKLEKHCSHCYRLDHELKDCLAAKHLKKKKKAKENALALGNKEEQSSSYGTNSVVTTEKSSHRGPSKYDNIQMRRSSYNSNSIKWVPKDDQRRDSSRQDESVPSQGDHLAGEDKARKLSANGEVSSSSKGDVREVMVQYSSCTDPLESAACKERQEQGQLEKTGAQIVRAALSKQQQMDTPQAGVSLTPEFVATLATSQPESRQTMMSGTSTTVLQYNGGEAPPQAWHRDSQTVHDDASDQSFQLYLYNADSQLSPPPPPSPRYYSSGGMIRGNMQYQGQGQGQSFNMPQMSLLPNMPQNNHPVSQHMRQQYQPEASIQNQNYSPVSSYQQANNYRVLTTNQAHHILDPSRFPAAMQPPTPDKANLEPQRQTAQLLQPMLSGAGDVEKDERYQRTLQFAASLLHQIK